MRTDYRTVIRAQRRIGVGVVEHDALDQRTKASHRCAFAGSFHLGNHIWCQLQVPGVVIFTSFHNRTTRRGRIATTFEGDLGKGRLARLTVIVIGRQNNHVIGTEFINHISPCADGVKVLFSAF